MSPQSNSAPWWQTLIVTAVNLGLGILAFHFGGSVAGAAMMSTGTAAAHVMTSPLDQK